MGDDGNEVGRFCLLIHSVLTIPEKQCSQPMVVCNSFADTIHGLMMHCIWMLMELLCGQTKHSKQHGQTHGPITPWNHKSSTVTKGNVGYERTITCSWNWKLGAFYFLTKVCAALSFSLQDQDWCQICDIIHWHHSCHPLTLILTHILTLFTSQLVALFFLPCVT